MTTLVGVSWALGGRPSLLSLPSTACMRCTMAIINKQNVVRLRICRSVIARGMKGLVPGPNFVNVENSKKMVAEGIRMS